MLFADRCLDRSSCNSALQNTSPKEDAKVQYNRSSARSSQSKGKMVEMGGVEPPFMSPSLVSDHSHSTPSYSPVILRVQEVGAGIACLSRSLQDTRQTGRRELSRSTDKVSPEHDVSWRVIAASLTSSLSVSGFGWSGSSEELPDSPYARTSSRSP